MIRIRVQHHPSRADLLPALLASLSPLPTEVIEHSSQPPSPWLGYKLCMKNPPNCSHLLIVQDDVVPAPGMVEVLDQIARDVPVCLFLARLPRDTHPRVEQAVKMNRRYIRLSQRSFMPVVAVLWPIEKMIEFDGWTEENSYLPGQREPRSDDAMAGRWKMINRQEVLATVPSLVEHPDVEPSTIGKVARGGLDRSRTAAFFAADAREYDWSMP